jgi:hypothetical protein
MFRWHKDKPRTDARWEKADGNVVSMELLASRTGNPPHPKRYVVEIFPRDRDPFQATIVVDPFDDKWDNFYYASQGDVRGFVFDPASGAASFDLSDKRNDRAAQMKAGDDLLEQVQAGVPAASGEAITGPPWVVPAQCPSCGAPVDQARARMEPDPKCTFCDQPLPVQPQAR